MITVFSKKSKNATALANAMRNKHIGSGLEADGRARGFLLVDADNDGEAKPLLEKLIHHAALPDHPVPVDSVPWKHDPQVVLIGSKAKLLDEFEKLVPGFTKKFGPVETHD